MADDLRATVVTAPTGAARYATVRFDGSKTPAPALVSSTVATALVAGQRVRVEMLGRRPLITGGL